jgi:hypothetical protein
MADEKSSYVHTGNISGTGIAIGQDVQSTVTITQGQQQELLDLSSSCSSRSRRRSSRKARSR